MRNVRVACILQSRFSNGRPNEALNSREKRLGEALDLLGEAGKRRLDLAVLSEVFADGAGSTAEDYESIEGPTISAVQEMAVKHKMYVIAPFSKLAKDGARYNAAALIDRNGTVTGDYCKNIPFWAEAGVTPGIERCVFHTDFGCLGIAICFESNWPDVWMDLGDQGAEIVIWPSAYSGGRKLTAAAIYNHYYVVSCTALPPDTTAVDLNGDVMSYVRGPGQVVFHDLDFDRFLVHENYNDDKLADLRREFGDRIKMRYFDREGWWLVESADASLVVKELLKERDIETAREFTRRSRAEIYSLREKGLPLPAHSAATGKLAE